MTIKEARGKMAITAEKLGFFCDPPTTDNELFSKFNPETVIVDGYKYQLPHIEAIYDDSGKIKRYAACIHKTGTYKQSELELHFRVLENAYNCVEQLNIILAQYYSDNDKQAQTSDNPQLSYTVTVLADGKVRVMDNINPKNRVECYDYGEMDNEQKVFYGLARYLDYEEAELLNFDDEDGFLPNLSEECDI